MTKRNYSRKSTELRLNREREKKAWNKFSAWLILFASHIIIFCPQFEIFFMLPWLLIFGYIFNSFNVMNFSELMRIKKTSPKSFTMKWKIAQKLGENNSCVGFLAWLARCNISQTQIHWWMLVWNKFNLFFFLLFGKFEINRFSLFIFSRKARFILA